MVCYSCFVCRSFWVQISVRRSVIVTGVCRISAGRQWWQGDKRPALKCVSMATFCIFIIHFLLITAAFIFPLHILSYWRHNQLMSKNDVGLGGFNETYNNTCFYFLCFCLLFLLNDSWICGSWKHSLGTSTGSQVASRFHGRQNFPFLGIKGLDSSVDPPSVTGKFAYSRFQSI